MGSFTLFLLLFFLLVILPAQAQDTSVDTALENLEDTAQINAELKTGYIENAAGAPTTFEIVGGLISLGLGILGIIFFILIIYGGIIWLTAGGNQESAGRAVKILQQSSIGVIIVITAYILTNVIIFRFIDLASAP